MQDPRSAHPTLTEKELDVIEILKLSFSTLKKSWAISLGVPAVISILYILFSYFQMLEILENLGSQPANPEDPFPGLDKIFRPFDLTVWLSSLVMLFLLYLSMIFPMRAAVRTLELRPLSSSSLGRHAFILFIATVLLSAGSLIGLVFCILPGMAFLVAFLFVPAAIIVEESGVGRAFSLAYRTFSVRKSKVLALALLLMLISGGFYFITIIPALIYYIYGLLTVIVNGSPDMLPEFLRNYVLLTHLGLVLALPPSAGLVGHALIIAYANFKNFVPAGPEF
ncbi:MAG: hypothetical protein RH862_09715 [Leptospiraceae bacterium]